MGRKQAPYSWSVSTSVGEVSVGRDKENITDVNERKFSKTIELGNEEIIHQNM